MGERDWMGVGVVVFFLFSSIGVVLGRITWYRPADCLVVIAQRTALPGTPMMEMSNAQSLFGLALCAVCVCACLCATADLVRGARITGSVSSIAGHVGIAAENNTPRLESFCLLVSFSSPFVCSSSLSLTHTNSHTQTHILWRVQMVLAAGLVFNVL